MKKILVMPDSFKGSLSSIEVCDIMSNRIRAFYPSCEIKAVPIADGGEGSIDCFLNALAGKRINAICKDPLGENMVGEYALIHNDKTAIIEMANCAGLTLMKDEKKPLETGTYGVGQLILDAALKNVNKVIVALGGSSTTDGGAGAAAALGVKFYDKNGQEFIPVGGTLINIDRIDVSHMIQEVKNIEFVTMCDIDNPMYGKTGAAYIFGPQKGANQNDIELLDAGLEHFSKIIKRDIGIDVSEIPGSGAAGGMGAGMVAFLNSKLTMGIDVVLDIINFDELIKDTDMIFTGEGRLDEQSLRGKVVIGIAKRVKKHSIPVVAVVGQTTLSVDLINEYGVNSVFTINRESLSVKDSMKDAAKNISEVMCSILSIMSIFN